VPRRAGRVAKFVPKGTLENQWNLILNACRNCNGRKADLENDISAITMQPDVLGKHFGDHPQLALDGPLRRTGLIIAPAHFVFFLRPALNDTPSFDAS
jgi:hypothetical protein